MNGKGISVKETEKRKDNPTCRIYSLPLSLLIDLVGCDLMPIEQTPFRKYHLEKKRDTFTVSLNSEERELLEKCKKIIEQSKDSSALKTLAWIGAKVIHEPKTTYLLRTLFKNKRNNQRLNINDFE